MSQHVGNRHAEFPFPAHRQGLEPPYESRVDRMATLLWRRDRPVVRVVRRAAQSRGHSAAPELAPCRALRPVRWRGDVGTLAQGPSLSRARLSTAPSAPVGAVMQMRMAAPFDMSCSRSMAALGRTPVSYTHLRAHETVLDLVCRLLLEK